MPRLVEGAGKALFSGWLSQIHALTGRARGLRWVGGRRVRWFLGRDAVVVLHRPADPTGEWSCPVSFAEASGTMARSTASSGSASVPPGSSPQRGRWSQRSMRCGGGMASNRDFEEMFSALSDAGVEFIVIGAHAVMFHSEPRYTNHLEIGVRPTRANASSNTVRSAR